jgi:ribosome-binding protein aMBF1 (putative translation factor)
MNADTTKYSRTPSHAQKITRARAKNKNWMTNNMAARRRVQLEPSIIRQKRLQKGLTQSQVATKLGMSNSKFGSIETGLRPVDAALAKKIAVVLGVPGSKDLFKEKGKKFIALKKTLRI